MEQKELLMWAMNHSLYHQVLLELLNIDNPKIQAKADILLKGYNYSLTTKNKTYEENVIKTLNYLLTEL